MSPAVEEVRWVGPAEVVVTGGEGLKKWYDQSRVRVPGYQFTPQYKAKRWDGYYYPGKFCRGRPGGGWEFRGSRGLLGRLEPLADHPLEVGDLDPKEVAALAGRIADQEDPPLRDYQRKALGLIFRHRWGRIALATNAGKGAVIALAAAHLQEYSGRKTLILCDEVAVFQALDEEIGRWAGVNPGKVESGVDEPPEDADIVLAMVPTLALRLKGDHPDSPVWRDWLSGFEACCLDEADKASSNTWRRVLSFLTRTEYRVGFSGTFAEDDEKKRDKQTAQEEAHRDLIMDELMGPIRLRVRNLELVERKISARPTVILHGFSVQQALAMAPLPADWEELSGPQKRLWYYDHAVIHNQERHEFLRSLIRPGIPTCVIVNRLEHGEELVDLLPGAKFLSGQDSKSVRTEVLDAFQRGDLDLLIVTRILDRGTNRLGRAADLIFASGEGSKRQVLQRIGRGLRREDGKEFLRLIDIIDRGAKYFDHASQKRIKLYAKEGFEIHAER